MTNIDSQKGFYCSDDQAPSITCVCPATDSDIICVGDIVEAAGSSDATGKYPAVKILSAVTSGIQPYGVMKSKVLLTNKDATETIHRLASTKTLLEITPILPGSRWVGQIDDTGDLANTDIQGNCDPVVISGNADTGVSKQELDYSTISTTATLMCTILRVLPRVGNALGGNAEVEFVFNKSFFYPGVTGL